MGKGVFVVQRCLPCEHMLLLPTAPLELELNLHISLRDRKVLEVFNRFDCVVAFISGHRHRDTYCIDDKGVHHVSLGAALEAPPDQARAYVGPFVRPESPRTFCCWKKVVEVIARIFFTYLGNKE